MGKGNYCVFYYLRLCVCFLGLDRSQRMVLATAQWITDILLPFWFRNVPCSSMHFHHTSGSPQKALSQPPNEEDLGCHSHPWRYSRMDNLPLEAWFSSENLLKISGLSNAHQSRPLKHGGSARIR